MKVKFKVFLKYYTKIFLLFNDFYINCIIAFISHFIAVSWIIIFYMENLTLICIEE